MPAVLQAPSRMRRTPPMNVGQLRAALANLPDHMPVVIEQEDIDLVGTYVELMHVERRDDLIYHKETVDSVYGLNRRYDRPGWGYKDTTPTEPAVIICCYQPLPPTIDGEIARPELGSGDQQ